MMANQCRTEMRWARLPDGLVSGTSEDMMHTVIVGARQHWQFVGRHQERPPKRELRFHVAIRAPPRAYLIGSVLGTDADQNLKNIF
jgi:hypothetical protein